MATPTARGKPLPSMVTTITATITALATIRTTLLPTARPLTTSQGHAPESPDPCLADGISGLHVSTGSDTSLTVAWAFSGDHKEFEVRYQASGAPEQALQVIGSPPELQLHSLHPGTEYRICIVPWSRGLLACLSPAPGQCTMGHTADTAWPVGTWPVPGPWALGIGTTATLLVLAGLAIRPCCGCRGSQSLSRGTTTMMSRPCTTGALSYQLPAVRMTTAMAMCWLPASSPKNRWIALAPHHQGAP
ncbi:uncharacterized protein [Apteryx mantelli]|uniref:Fibronectin type-III domain-containing protein n=1 Tax=Apteryx mantelli TaxID=2696672 RepID=A0ABM4FNW7_9AVES